MKKFATQLRTLLAFILLVSGTTVAGAFDFTVNESTTGDGDGRLPVYGIYAGAYQKCEFVIPSTVLASIDGAAINKLTFYIQDISQRTYIGNCKVFLKEVDFTEYTAKKYSGMNGSTLVYEGPIDATHETLEVSFSEDVKYEYKGGNLLIGMYVTEKSGAGGTVSFYGVHTDTYPALASYSWDNFQAVDDVNQMEIINFMPTVTFGCSNTPHNITADCTHGTMTFAGCNADNTAEVGKTITVTVTPDEGYVAGAVSTNPAEEVTVIDAANASFIMPDHSITVISKCLRDISYKVDVTEPLRFATGENISFELIDVIDASNPKTLIQNEDYTVTFDKTPSTPGKYTATFTGIGDYTNSFTKEFTVQIKHDVTLAAHYFGTYFYATGIETFDDMDLATVTAVAADGTATLTKLTETKVAKNYPFLIYNPYDEEKTFTLWETIDDPNVANPTPAAQFTGTADDKAFTADDTAAKDYYVLQNGKEFVYVIGAGTKPAHRCWIELPKAAGSRLLTIAIDQTTGISEVKAAQIADGIYDLQGRRLTGKPSQRGMYVIDGKKVVVK